MTTSIKDGVDIRGISTEILLAIIIAERLYDSAKEVLTITSVVDGRHMEGSLHYSGKAVDLRLPLVVHPKSMCDALRKCLGDQFDVVLEDTHIHVEFDPK